MRTLTLKKTCLPLHYFHWLPFLMADFQYCCHPSDIIFQLKCNLASLTGAFPLPHTLTGGESEIWLAFHLLFDALLSSYSEYFNISLLHVGVCQHWTGWGLLASLPEWLLAPQKQWNRLFTLRWRNLILPACTSCWELILSAVSQQMQIHSTICSRYRPCCNAAEHV